MKRRRVRVLVADDNPAWLDIMERIVKQADPTVEILRAENGYQANRCIGCVDCAVLDHRMPGVSGDEVRAKADRLGKPVVLVSSHRPLSLAGAAAFVEKDVDEVDRAVRSMLRDLRGPRRVLAELRRAVA